MSLGKALARGSFALTLLAASSGRAQTSQYAVTQTIALHQAGDGIEGTLQVLADKRLSEELRNDLWGHGDWSLVFSPDSDIYRDFSDHPPVKSKLRIRNSKDGVIAELDLATVLAKLEAWPAAARTSHFFLLTRDYSIGAGSYNGPGTTLLTVWGATLHEMKALNADSGKEQPIRLMRALKSDWRIAEREDHPEILSVSCHPGSNLEFVIDYTRYTFEGQRWVEHTREVDGFWESDQPFPAKSAFP